MARRQAVVFVAVALAAVAWVSAAEQATFVLKDGYRVSGALAAHGRTGTNVRSEFGEFSIATNEGLELVVPIDRVAYIEFAGGNPSNQELEALPSGSHMLALRNGTQRTGRLVDFIGGDRVRFQAGLGRQDIPVRDVARIYLDRDSSRSLHNYRPSGGFGRGNQDRGGGGGLFNRGGADRAGDVVGNVEIRGAVPWTNTGIRVRAGEHLYFTTTGAVFWARTEDARATADGVATQLSKSYPVTAMGVGGLIARVQPNNQAFPIGSNQERIRMPATGFLQLGINDDNFEDNSGTYRVQIRRER